MSLSMRRPTICIRENKDADQLCSYCTADQHLCFRFLDSMIPVLLKSKISSFKPASLAVQAGLCQTWSETQILDFVMQRFKCENRDTNNFLSASLSCNIFKIHISCETFMRDLATFINCHSVLFSRKIVTSCLFSRLRRCDYSITLLLYYTINFIVLHKLLQYYCIT